MIRKEKIEELESYIDELKTIKKRLILNPQRKFITSLSYEYTLNNGRIINRQQILKNGLDGSAVIVVPHLKELDEYLIVVEPRVFTKLGVGVSFPAGYIDEDEKGHQAAYRELKEETGYVADEYIYLDSFYQDQGVSSAYNHIYLANNCTRQFEQELGESEIVRYMSVNLEELEEFERKNYICGGNTKLALCKLKKYKGVD